MKNFKNYTTFASGLVIIMVLLLIPIRESKSQSSDAIRLLATVAHNHARQASQEAARAAEKQRALVKSLAGNGSSGIGGGIGNRAAEGEEAQKQSGRLTAREIAREKAMLQQLEANARRAAEVLESVKRLAAEVDRQPRR